MNPFVGIGIFSAIVYWCFVDAAFFKIYFIILLAFIALTQLGTFSRFNNFRVKRRIATWYAPNDPQILMNFDWDMTKSDEYIEKKRKESGLPISITHFLAFCVSRGMHEQQDFNGRLSFGNVMCSTLINLVLSERAGRYHIRYNTRRWQSTIPLSLLIGCWSCTRGKHGSQITGTDLSRSHPECSSASRF